MKILHILDHSLPHIDGYSIRSHNILVHQRKYGFEVLAVTSPKHENSHDTVETIDGIRFFRTPYREVKRGIGALPFVKEGLLMWQLAGRIFEIACKEKVDLIHAHSPSLNGIPAYTVAYRLGLPVVYEVRSLWEEGPQEYIQSGFGRVKFVISRWIETCLVKHMPAVATISQGLKQEIVARGIPERKVYVFPNGVDPEQFCPRHLNEELKRRLRLEGRFVVGFIGSFSYWEGLDLLLRSMREVVKRCPGIHLLLVGADEGDQFKKLTRSLQLDSFVTFTGKVATGDILDYYSIIDLCVYPRRKMRLTDLVTPLKPLEAMALEKLVLASDVGGHKELITDSVTGFLFSADSEAELARHIIDIASRAELLHDIRRNARLQVCETRNWGSIVSRYAEVYKSLQGTPMQEK